MERGRWLCPTAVVLLLMVAWTTAASALTLTMDETVTRAIAASRDLRVSRKQIEVAKADLDRSSALLPANPFVSAGGQSVVPNQFGPNYGFTVSQEFEIGGQRSKRMAAAKQGVDRATWDLKSAEMTLVATVKQTFVHSLLGADRIAVARRGVDAARTLTQSLQENGARTEEEKIDLNIARVQEARAQRDLAQAQQNSQDALDLLRYYLGLPSSQPVELKGVPITEVKELPPVGESVERALKQRPDLVALRHSAEHAGLEVDLKRRERIPNITVSGNLSRFEGDTFFGGDLGVYLPIFQTGAPALREALAERGQMQAQIDDLKRTIEWDVRQARRACEAARVSLQISKEQIVPESEANLEMEQARFRRGEVAVADLVGVQIDAIFAQREYLDAVQQYNDSLFDLQRATGEVPELQKSP